ncbi:MAG: glycoside-pentoside-hexuronide (GPH):cation symporter [Clostridiales bacterium]|nr:glycoside-pentoside-hexuronide (GPH):cation symporter [Clostridiales bacterium]
MASTETERSYTPVHALPKAKRYVGFKESLAYGLASGGKSFIAAPTQSGYLSIFFIKVFGLPAGAVSFMMLLSGMWDAFNDPLIGSVIDKTRTRYGKLRPWLLLTPLPFAVLTVLLFGGPRFFGGAPQTVKIIYMYLSYLMWEMCYTCADVPFNGMTTAISPLPEDRTRVISYSTFIAGILAQAGQLMLLTFMDASEKGLWHINLRTVFLLIGVISALFGGGLFSLSGIFTRERVAQSIREPSILESFRVLTHNKPLMLIILSNMLMSAGGLYSVFTTYYFAEVAQLNSLKMLIDLPGGAVGMATYAFIPAIKRRFDNRKIMLIHFVAKAVAGVLCFLTGMRHYTSKVFAVPILMFLNIVISIANTVRNIISVEMIGDTIDYMELRTGERNEGVSFAASSFFGKLTSSVSTAIATAVLPIIGLTYRTEGGRQIAVKGEKTDFYIWMFYVLVPQLVNCLGMIPYFWYDLSGDRLASVRAQLAERREQLLTGDARSENDDMPRD